MTHTLHLGDCRTVLATLDDASIDAIVCDPPYELGFMGKAWDNSGIAYDVTVWRQCLRVLKPGGHLVAFGGSRTYHRLAVAIEDAGFEIRDQIQWIYGSGFPKSLDVSKAMDKQAGAVREVVGRTKQQAGVSSQLRRVVQSDQGYRPNGEEYKGLKLDYVPITAPATDLAKQWQGWGTALKPAHEPAVLARKPLCGTVADNVTAWGVGALNIDGARVGSDGGGTHCNNRDAHGKCKGHNNAGQSTQGETFHGREPLGPAGRWPANVILDEEAAQVLDGQSGHSVSDVGNRGLQHSGRRGGIADGGNIKEGTASIRGHSDSGGASRFFYTAKASKSEREAGLYYDEWVKGGGMQGTEDGSLLTGSGNVRNPLRANHHPTVKPLALMRYLVRLVTPKGGKVLDPFMGSGSTGCAAVREGFDFVGIDVTPEYVAIAQKRIAHYAVESPLEGMLQ